jgi:hypothetical protein
MPGRFAAAAWGSLSNWRNVADSSVPGLLRRREDRVESAEGQSFARALEADKANRQITEAPNQIGGVCKFKWRNENEPCLVLI